MSEARRGPATTGIGVAFEITGEPILFNRSSSFVMKRQMEEIRKVYQRLTVLVILATVVLMLAVGSGVVRSGTGMFNALISLR